MSPPRNFKLPRRCPQRVDAVCSERKREAIAGREWGMRIALLGLPLALASCQVTDSNQSQQHQQGQKAQQLELAQNRGPTSPAPDPLASRDPRPGQAAPTGDFADPEARPLMQAQVVLDRLGFTPGVVDGKEGLSTRNAVSGFQEANNLTVTGKVDDPTRQALAKWNDIPATRVVTIPADFAAGPFYVIPKDPADQAKMPALGYQSLDEKLAERFHTTIDTLKQLNPGGVPAGAKPAPQATAPGGGTLQARPAPSATETLGPNSNGSGAAVHQPGAPSYFHAG